ncbi:MAG: ribosome biogenesis GTPase Der [Chitinophagaceae bacterium]|nr:MAG: ribosome biogenesis GTPase Der [Chitinophagaceae bacterium]
MSFTVAIVGRPNVGKSTLFNRLVGMRKAIVDNVSGVTRDRQYGVCEWNGKEFTIVDTGGFVAKSEDKFEAAIRDQVKIAISEADLILFMLDVTTGITALDSDMTDILRKHGKKTMVVLNKVDNSSRELLVPEFYGMGFEKYYSLSSINGKGTGELLDDVVLRIQDDNSDIKSDLPKIAILGQPNVGKSSLLNAFVGEERNIVTDIAGTTRDAIHTEYKLFDKNLMLIDTAGLRKKAKVHENLEFYSVMRAVRALEEADVCIIMVDATLGLESQDLNILSLAYRKKKGIVLAVNKWDLIQDKESNTSKEFMDELKRRTAPFVDYPVLFISAIEKQRILKVLETSIEVFEKRKKKIPTSQLNKFLEEVSKIKQPPSYKGKYVKIKYITQLPTHTPTFGLFCNFPKYVKEEYRNFLENQMRKKFDFTGVPIKLIFKEK